MDADGDFAIIWESYQDRSQDGDLWMPDTPNSFGIYAQRFANNESLAVLANLGENGEVGGEIDVNVTKSGKQRGASIALDDTGDVMSVWSGYGPFDDQGIFTRRFTRIADDAGPTVTDVVNIVPEDVPDNDPTLDYYPEQILWGSTTTNEPTQFIVTFGENLSTEGGVSGVNSILNTLNWQLTGNGIFLSQGVTAIEFGQSQGSAHLGSDGVTPDPLVSASSKYEAIITFDGDPLVAGNQPLPAGEYMLTLTDDVEDLFGNPLDGDYDGHAGGNFRRPFYVGELLITGSQPGDPGDDDDGDGEIEDDPIFDNNLYDQRDPAIATSADGNYVIVGVSDGTATDVPYDDPANALYSQSNIVARRYDRYGNPLSSEFVVNSFLENDQESPDIAMDEYGNFVIVWAGEGELDSQAVYARVFDPYGVPLTGQIRVHEEREGPQWNPTVGMDSSGNFTVVWQEYVVGRSQELVGRQFSFRGEPLGDQFPINTYIDGNQLDPDIAMAGDGDFTVVWTSSNQDSYEWGIYGQRFDQDAAMVGEEFRVNQVEDGTQTHSAVAMDIDGDFVVTWTSDKQDGSWMGVYARQFDNLGGAGDEFLVNQVTMGNQENSDVSMSVSGEYIVTWSTFDQEEPNYDPVNNKELHDMGIYARIFEADGSDYLDADTGSPVGEFKINDNLQGNQVNPVVAMDADGDFMVAWVGPDQYFDGYYDPVTFPPGTVVPPGTVPLFSGTHDIYYRAFAVNPGLPGEAIAGSAFSGNSYNPHSYAVMAAGGGYQAAYLAEQYAAPSVVVIMGTDGDDTLEFVAGRSAGSWRLALNDVMLDVPYDAALVRFDGGEGTDTVRFTGTDVKDSIEFWAAINELSISSLHYEFGAQNVENVEVDAQGGSDSVILWDTVGDDKLVSGPDRVEMTGLGYSAVLTGVDSVFAYAMQGGRDEAVLLDSPGIDRVRISETNSAMYRPGSFVRVKGFEDVTAVSQAGGRDTAYAFGSVSDDEIHVSPDIVTITDKSAQGIEKAYLNRVVGFASTFVSGFSGNDQATIIGSTGDDQFLGDFGLAKMAYSNGSTVMLDRVSSVSVDGGEGVDSAILSDTPGDDLLTQAADVVTLSSNDADIYQMIAFDRIAAHSRKGGDDKTDLEEIDLIMLYGDWDQI
jgi:hypothetical protein